jgi:hypothetical protein
MAKYLKTTPRSVIWFKQINDREELEMKPPFQRNLVWTEKQKSYLIDSILNEYPVPEIYMQEIVTESGKVKYIIVDGQQRLRAILGFLNNEFTMDPADSPQWADLSFEELRAEEKKKIYEYDLIARCLPDIPDTEIRAIFQRLNRNNVALNQQELRQATYWGYFINTMNEIAAYEIWGKLDFFTSNDIKRMLDVEFISELTIAILHGHQNKKLTIDKYYELYEKEFNESARIKEIFDSVLRELLVIIPTTTNRWLKKADFYSLFIVLARHKDKLPLNLDKRELIQEKLSKLGQQLDIMVSTKDEKAMDDYTKQLIDEGFEIVLPDKTDFSENALKYGTGMRASTDLGSRKRRDEALEAELAELWMI